MKVITFPNITSISSVQHAVFSRHGGYSQDPYKSLNLSFGVGDENDLVLKNRRIVSSYFNTDVLVFVNQVHGNNVLTIDGVSLTGKKSAFVDAGTADALVTNIPGVCLVIQTADCQSVMMIDPQKNVIANAHVGWRGSVQNIIARTIGEMEEKFDCRPSDLKVGIGPSLGPCCAEFVNYRLEIPKNFWRYKDDKHRFDFWTISSQQVADAGVLKENLFVSNVCTKCHTKRFFSYRAQQVTGRFASAIALRRNC